MSVAVMGLKSAIQDGYLQVTRAMLQEQISRIDRIGKEQELLRYCAGVSELTQEQYDRYRILTKILSDEYVYLRIMQRSMG